MPNQPQQNDWQRVDSQLQYRHSPASGIVARSRLRIEYERWLEENLPAYRVLDVTAQTAARYAEVRLEMKQAGTPLPANDTWIAALCRQHRLPILSRDQHFDLVKGVERLAW